MGYPALCCQSVATLDTIRISENDMKIKHIRLSREAASTILLLKPGMDRIDKTCSKKVDPMPPICTCGYSIANGRWMMLGKAAYLFVLNAYFIFLSAKIVSYAGFRISDLIPTRSWQSRFKRFC